ncbi:S-adenosyl-L-methionine-dependent methyltransferase [Athelia psychrophila]|uniref:S-adenosyl-L-methionine-dependent methyltransferase n=1 Tax=Athelia psychrophila TaxID=1759441 RepID=A0A167UD29_9AGAM|nr:S-adenosyl-L-methionine-dependent methyltransferase [Fibularhizoctonia sp. CBS 109695]
MSDSKPEETALSRTDNGGIQHHNARTYASSESYILPSDEAERQRLDHQHGLFKRNFENRLFLAPVALKAGDRVLDSGTGAGSWLLDFAGEVPDTVAIYGIDISPRLFPANPPANAHLSTQSVTQLPADWSATFALVNQRHLVGGLTATAWKAALAEIYRVLVPGGWVNLFEMNCDSTHMDYQQGPATFKMLKIVDAVFRSVGALPDAVYHLRGWLEEAGFVNVDTQMRRLPLCHGAPGQDTFNSYVVHAALKTPVMKAGGFGLVSSDEEYDQLALATQEELWSTENAAVQNFMIYAQKPAV